MKIFFLFKSILFSIFVSITLTINSMEEEENLSKTNNIRSDRPNVISRQTPPPPPSLQFLSNSPGYVINSQPSIDSGITAKKDKTKRKKILNQIIEVSSKCESLILDNGNIKQNLKTLGLSEWIELDEEALEIAYSLIFCQKFETKFIFKVFHELNTQQLKTLFWIKEFLYTVNFFLNLKALEYRNISINPEADEVDNILFYAEGAAEIGNSNVLKLLIAIYPNAFIKQNQLTKCLKDQISKILAHKD